MTISLVNLSPRGKSGASGEVVRLLNEKLSSAEVYTLGCAGVDELNVRKILHSDAIVFAFPLYVDALPSNALEWLRALANSGGRARPFVYCAVNCGFYEGEQTELAMEIIKNFCDEAGFIYGGGIGIGSGGMIPYISRIPFNMGPRKTLEEAISLVSLAADEGCRFRNRFYTVGVSRKIYKLIAEKSFRICAKKNGVNI